jgi:hypothetical protein
MLRVHFTDPVTSAGPLVVMELCCYSTRSTGRTCAGPQ